MKISVWSPKASKVTAVYSGGNHALSATTDGYWHTDLPVGTRYHLRLDNNELLLPDPRSMCQPEGPHGPSELIDPTSFSFEHEWTCPPLRGKVFYELHIGTFTPGGTFRSAIDRLDDLVDLGVDVIELMPINPIPGSRGWGYDSVSIYALNPNYGSPTDLVALIDAAHARGIAVCLDVVYNHFGPDGNYLSQFGPYFTGRHHTPWGDAVNFDGGEDEVRRYVIDNALMWVRDYRFDALRLDATDFFIDDSPRHVLADLSAAVADYSAHADRNITLIAESDANKARTTLPVADGGWGMDMQWVDDVHHALHVWLTGETNAFYCDHADDHALGKAFTQGFTRTGQVSQFTGEPHGEPTPAELNGHTFVVFDENHDQVGNRLIGDRPSYSLSRAELAISRALILLSPFTPMLFMGEEWGTTTPFMFFTDHGPEIGKHIKAGRESEFEQWDLASVYPDGAEMVDPQDSQAYHASVLDWENAGNGKYRELRDFVRQLIRLRRSVPDIASGERAQTSFWLNPERTAGYLQRGSVFVVFSREANQEITLPSTPQSTLVSWGKNEIDGNSVHFVDPGVIALTTKD